MADPIRKIKGEDNPWYCPNCGSEADAEIIHDIRIVSCRSCRAEFEVSAEIGLIGRRYSNG